MGVHSLGKAFPNLVVFRLCQAVVLSCLTEELFHLASSHS